MVLVAKSIIHFRIGATLLAYTLTRRMMRTKTEKDIVFSFCFFLVIIGSSFYVLEEIRLRDLSLFLLLLGALPSIASPPDPGHRVSGCSHAQGVEHPYCVRIRVLGMPGDRYGVLSQDDLGC